MTGHDIHTKQTVDVFMSYIVVCCVLLKLKLLNSQRLCYLLYAGATVSMLEVKTKYINVEHKASHTNIRQSKAIELMDIF